MNVITKATEVLVLTSDVSINMYGTHEDPLFLADDISRLLGNDRSRKMIEKIDNDYKEQAPFKRAGAKQSYNTYFVTEDGLYDCLLLSRTKTGQEFRRIIRTLIKDLRKGNLKVSTPVTRLEWMKAAVKAEEELLLNAPKVEAWDQFLDSDSCVTATNVAKSFHFKSAIAFNKKLHDLGIQWKQGKTWVLYAKYSEEGYTKEIQNEHGGASMKWTPKGLEFLTSILNK